MSTVAAKADLICLPCIRERFLKESLFLCQLAQTIFTLDLRYIKNDKYTIQIAFQSVLKHSRPGRHVKSVILTFYLADKKICLVEVFNTYLKATKEIRKCETKLKIL